MRHLIPDVDGTLPVLQNDHPLCSRKSSSRLAWS